MQIEIWENFEPEYQWFWSVLICRAREAPLGEHLTAPLDLSGLVVTI